ncbi:RcnB family protein [Pseudomonas purpurea]|uniref:RcnB family protein n=1 Tax=Pseudomonas purpurea TaxID=3136737 RepID=UPI0032659FD7
MTHNTFFVAMTMLAAIVGTSPAALADDPPERTAQASIANLRSLHVGDRVPDAYKRGEKALANWQQRGLKTPKSLSQWVQVNDRYMMVRITDGQILDVTPIER